MSPKATTVNRIFEARYERGWRYLDRCGEVLLILEELLPGETGKTWLVDDATPGGTHLKSPDLDVVLTFSGVMMNMQQNPVTQDFDFERVAAAVYATMVGRFDIRSITRLGARRMMMLPVDSVAEAERLSIKHSSIGSWPLNADDRLKPKRSEIATTFELEDESAGIRFSVAPAFRLDAPIETDERLKGPPRWLPKGQREALIAQLKRQKQRQDDPEAGLLIDTDFYWAFPKNVAIDAFFKDAWSTSDRLTNAFLERNR
jgi:hypothetical protein